MSRNAKLWKLLRRFNHSIFFPGKFWTEGGESFKDLGIITNQHLSWNPQKYYVKRTCKGLDNPSTLSTLYCSLVRSNLECCSVVWSTYTKRNINMLERVQRRATKFVSKSDDPTDIRVKKLNIMLLEKRLLTDITFLYEVLSGNINTDIHNRFYRFLLRSWPHFT